MNIFFSPTPIQLGKGLAIVRVIMGILLLYHGREVFQPETMKEYLEWDIFKTPAAKFMVYAGKSSELIAGISLLLGLFTRVGALLIIGTFLYITFFIGEGRFWYEDQHPFMFALFGLLLLFSGPGSWSLDGIIFGHKHSR